MPRSFGGDVFRVYFREMADASAAKYRLWLGGGTKRIHVVWLSVSAGGSSLVSRISLVRLSGGGTINVTAATPQVPLNLNDGGPLVPGGVLCYVTAGADTMAPSATPDVIKPYDQAAGGVIFHRGFFKGELSVAPGSYLGVQQVNFGAGLMTTFALEFTVEP